MKAGEEPFSCVFVFCLRTADLRLLQSDRFTNVNPLLSLAEAQESIRPISEFIESQNGTVVIEELPSWYTFFEKYILKAEPGVGGLFVCHTI
jgi:hypothetical protein